MTTLRTRVPHRPSQRVLAPIAATCAECGGPAVLSPFSAARGACYCPRCSPGWLGEWMAWMQEGGAHTDD